MRNLMRSTLLASMLLLSVCGASAQVSVGVRIGPPPPRHVIHEIPPQPGPGYIWVDGYWYAAGHHYRWHEGYWTLPPYEGARWVGPRHDGERFYHGYWEGPRGRVEHRHEWDRDRERDHDRYREHYEHH